MEDAMKLLFFIPVWKRPEITEICFMGIRRLQKIPGFQISAFSVISEPDMIPLCEKYGVDWCMHPNFPLGAKKNYGLSQAMKKDFDYLIELGSDDVLKDEVLQAYKWGSPVVGLLDFILMDVRTGSCKLLSTHIPKFGAGRAFRKDVLSEKLWNDGASRGMDNFSTFNLAKKGFMQSGAKWEFPLAVSLKSETNIWNYRQMLGKRYPIEKALCGLSEDEIHAISSLHATATV